MHNPDDLPAADSDPIMSRLLDHLVDQLVDHLEWIDAVVADELAEIDGLVACCVEWWQDTADGGD